MEKVENFAALKQAANEASKQRRNEMYEEEIAYNGYVPQFNDSGVLIKDQSYYEQEDVVSTYMTSDYQVSIDTYAESMFFKLPTIRMNSADGVMSGEDSTAINKEFRRISMLSDMDRRIMSVLYTGIRKAVCVSELIPKKVSVSGKVGIGGELKDPDVRTEWTMDLIKYNPLTTYIDPNADPDNIRRTADYCIVDVGSYSEETFKAMAKLNGWNVDIEKLCETKRREDILQRVRKIDSMDETDAIKVSKLFTRDGMVQVVFNDTYGLKPKINVKRIKEMPLIFYTSIPGSSSPYGRLFWNMIKLSAISKSAMTSLILDAVGKNYSAPIITDNPKLAGKNLSDYGKDDFVYIANSGNKAIKDGFFQLSYADMTQGAMYAIQQFNEDIAKVSKLNDMQFGYQDKTIRTNAIASQLNKPSMTKNSSLVKQFEQTFMRDFVRDFWWILVSFYDDFKLKGKINREKLNSVSSITCVNGSTLEQDQMTQIDILNFALSYIEQFADANYSVDSILDALFEQVGWIDYENYKLPPEESFAKMLITNYGLDPQAAAAIAQQTINGIQGMIQSRAGGVQV